MKSLVLLCLVSVVYSHPHIPISNFPTIYYAGNEVNETFDINTIGTVFAESLECKTDLETCCSRPQGPHRGDWYFPDGSRLDFSFSSDHIYESRHDKSVWLHRRGNNVDEGDYCCKIETKQVHRDDPSQAEYVGEEICVKLLNYSKECPSMGAPENGQVYFHDYPNEDVKKIAEFTCNRGYELVGKKFLSCFAGEWIGDRPICEDSCEGGKKWYCGSLCRETCDTYGFPTPPCLTDCEDGCFCPGGTVEHNGMCIQPEQCPNWCLEPHIHNGTTDVMGYGVNDTVTFTCDDGFEAVGETKGICLPNRFWSIDFECRGCVDKLYVMAFTSTVSGGGSNDHHSLFISYKEGNVTKNMTIEFFNRQGDDMFSNKGDLWAFDLRSYGLPCLGYHDVKKVAIVQSSYDNWHIESVATVLSINTYRGIWYAALTLDMEANRWIDNRDGHRRFDLTRYRSFHRQRG